MEDIIRIARQIRDQRYSRSEVAFAAGSLIRGEATRFSDIDLVVVYDHLPQAYRESFTVASFPVEAFVHDPETLAYFMDEDCASGIPSLPQMIKEGVEVPESTPLSRILKARAESVLAAGPPKLTDHDQRAKRYGITDLVDDLRDPRSGDELMATGVRLYAELADHYLRTNGFWSGTGKSIPRALKKADPTFFGKYTCSFQELFREAKPQAVIDLAEEVLKSQGGFLFDGYRLDAPSDWRKP